MATPAGFENEKSDATRNEDAPVTVEKNTAQELCRDVSRNVDVPSLVQALEDAIRAGDTARALELVALLGDPITARRARR